MAWIQIRLNSTNEKAEKIMRKMYEKGYMIKEIAQITNESEETIKDILQVM